MPGPVVLAGAVPAIDYACVTVLLPEILQLPVTAFGHRSSMPRRVRRLARDEISASDKLRRFGAAENPRKALLSWTGAARLNP